MPTVAELDVQVDAKDQASGTLTKIGQMIDQLEGRDADVAVDANTSGAEQNVKDFERELDRLTNASRTVTVEAATKVAQSQLERIERQIEDMNATLDVDADVAQAKAKIEGFLRSMRYMDANVNAEVDTTQARAAVAALQAQLAAIKDKQVEVEVDTDNAKTNMNELAFAAERVSGNVRGLAAAIGLLGPALVPLAAVATPAVVGLAGAFTTAGIGAGLFGAIAYSAFNDITDITGKMQAQQALYNQAVTDKQRDTALKKMTALWETLTPAQQAAAQGLLDFQSAWASFAAQFEPQIFEMAGRGLQGIARLLPTMTPIVQATADALENMMDRALAALAGPFWTDFFDFVGRTAGPNLEGLIATLGNLARMFAGIMMAFEPMTTSFIDGMVRMTDSWADWAETLGESQGFQDFVDYMKANTPVVLDFLGRLVDFIVALVRAAAPIGTVVLGVITQMMEGFTNLQSAAPILATLAVLFVGVGLAVMNMVGPIISWMHWSGLMTGLITVVKTAFAGILGTLGLSTAAFWGIVAGVAAVVAGLIYAYNHFESFREVVDRAAAAVVDGFQAAISWLQSVLQPVIAAVVAFAITEWNKMVAWASENTAAFQAAWDTIKNIVIDSVTLWVGWIQMQLALLKVVWDTFWPLLSGVVLAAWEVIKGVVSGAMEQIRGVITVITGLINGDWSLFWDGIRMIAEGQMAIIQGVIDAGWLILQGIWDTAINGLQLAWDAFWNLLPTPIQTALTLVGTSLTAAWTQVQTAWDTGIAALQLAWDAFWDNVWVPVSEKLIEVRDTYVTPLLAEIELRFTDFEARVMAQWEEFWNALPAPVQTSLLFIQSWAQGVLIFIQTAFQTFVSVVTTMWQGFWTSVSFLAQHAMGLVVAYITTGFQIMVATITMTLQIAQAVVTTAFQVITAVIQGAITTIVAVVTMGFNNAVATIRLSMSVATAIIQTAWTVITTIFRTVLSVITTIVVGAFATIRAIIQGDMDKAWATIQATWQRIQTTVSTALSTIVTAVTTGFQRIVTAIIVAGVSILSNIRSTWNTVWTTVTTTVSRIVTSISSGFIRMVAAARTGMSNIVSAIVSGAGRVVAQITSMGTRMVAAVTGLASRFYSAGRSLISNLASGITSRVSAAVSAVRDAVSRVTAWLPGSPAEVGPLSGRGYSMLRGQRMVEDLARGLASERSLVDAEAARLAQSMTEAFSPRMGIPHATPTRRAGALATAGAEGRGATITVAQGAIQITLGAGVDPEEARAAFDGAEDDLAEQLLAALRRR